MKLHTLVIVVSLFAFAMNGTAQIENHALKETYPGDSSYPALVSRQMISPSRPDGNDTANSNATRVAGVSQSPSPSQRQWLFAWLR
jgi:hypothetical protein